MTLLPNIPTVSFGTAANALYCAALANKVVLLIGDPGVGKTTIVRNVARKLQLPCKELLGSTLDPTDVGGLPVKHVDELGQATVERIPLKCIAQAAKDPAVLFLDEISSAPAAVQAAFLRLILDRVAGDTELHPNTVVVAACNPPEQTPGGFDLTAPLMGRMSVMRFRPTDTEVVDYLRTLGDSDSEDAMEKAIAEEASLFAAIASVSDNLLQIDLPKEAVNGGQPWASPRQCEAMIRMRAAATVAGLDPMDDAVYALMAGCIGERTATVYNGIMRTITELPSVDEIVTDPEGAKLPDERVKQIAALGLMTRIAMKNNHAAYIYAARMVPEFGLAAHKALLPLEKYRPPITDKLTKKGTEARSKIAARIAGGRKAA